MILTKKNARLLLPLLYVAILFVFQEVLFRTVFPVPEVLSFRRTSYTPMKLQENLRVPNLAHASYTIGSALDGASFVHYLNLYGFRDRDWKLSKSKTRILFAGDSIVEGFMAPQHETIPSGFGEAARRAGITIETMNMGISGAGMEEYLRLLRDAVPLFRPDTVVLVVFPNDFPSKPFDRDTFLRATPLEYPRPYVPRVARVVSGLLDGDGVPLAWHSSPFAFFPPVPNPANPWSDPSHHAAHIEPRVLAAMKQGAFNPIVVDEALWMHGMLSADPAIGEHLAALQEYLRSYDADFLLVYMPYRLQLNDYYLPFVETFSRMPEGDSFRSATLREQAKKLGRIADSLNIPYFDLTDFLQDREDRGIRCAWDYDAHFRGESNLACGEAIFRSWKAYRKNGSP